MPRGTSLLDEARLQGRLWTPALAGDRQPLHWLDYQSDPLTMSGATITQAAPQGGRNRNTWATKSSGTNPSLVTRNGFRAARFDGSQPMTHIVTTGTGYVNCTYVIAGYMISGGANEDIVFGFGNAAPSPAGAGRWMYRAPNSGTIGMAGWAIDIGSSGTSWDIAGVTPRVFGARKIGQPVSFDRDGSVGASIISFPSNPPATVNPTLCLGGINGAGGSNAYGTNMDFFEVMAWEYELTDYEYQRAQAYLCWKYNLPIVASNPFRNRPPLIGD
jgi:hypothetical protein